MKLLSALALFAASLSMISMGYTQTASMPSSASWPRSASLPTTSRMPAPTVLNENVCQPSDEHATPSKYRGCVPPREFIAAPDSGTGQYMRVHPDGTHVILSGPARIWDLSKRDAKGAVAAKSIPTPLNAEAYPVEGDWKLIASPNHPDGMRYYQFDELTEKNRNAQAVFSDGQHNEFYHSVGQLPDSTQDQLRFRTLLYSAQQFRDYAVSKDASGRYTNAAKSKVGQLCATIRKPGESNKTSPEQLQKRAEGLRRIAEIRIQLSELQSISPRPIDYGAKQQALVQEYYRTDAETNGQSGNRISLPVLSKDGTEVLGAVGFPPTTKVLKILDNNDCEIVEDLGYQTGKAMFSYPEKSKKGKIVFSSDQLIPGAESGTRNMQRVFVYDRDTKSTKSLSDKSESFGSYPNMTRDGRVMYLSTRKGCKGLVVVDTNQLPGGDSKKCAKLDAPNLDAGAAKRRSTIQ